MEVRINLETNSKDLQYGMMEVGCDTITEYVEYCVRAITESLNEGRKPLFVN